VVVVVFWASWCTWCHRWWPVLDALAGSHAARPRVLPLNIRDEPEAARAYLRRTGLTWPLRQVTEATAELWQAHATPHTVVVDASGHISGVISGFDPEGRALGQALDIALAASERMFSSP
jgi:thiol-disulfide isomerase/thioredoxin